MRSLLREELRLPGSESDTRATVQIVQSEDRFFDVLVELCAGSLAATIEPRSRHNFDAVLLACDREVLIYEYWNRARGIPAGELGVIRVDDVAAIRVS